jgi:prevent-host-death family protein
MNPITVTELRTNIYNLLDEVLTTGLPLEIRKGNRTLRIVPVEKVDKLHNLIARPQAIQGDPDALVDLGWEDEVNLDLP